MPTAYDCVRYGRGRMRPVAEWPCVALCNMLQTIRHPGTPAKADPRSRYGYIASRPAEAVKSGDTDTTAAAAGALAGVYHGFGAIPPEWVGRNLPMYLGERR